MMAMMSATVAFSIDAMLPALPEIGAALSPDNLNNAQLIVTSFVFGLGVGTLFTGPLSDAFGRKPVMVVGSIIYILACLVAWISTTIEVMVAARVVQGLGAAAPRVVALAIVRDLYGGRNMAQIISFIMVVFSIVPALAPAMGYYIVVGFGWRAIFASFMLFSLVSMIWLVIRQPETLTPDNKRPLSAAALAGAIGEMFAHPTTRLSIFIQTLTFGMLFIILSSVQQVFDITFGQGDLFHLWIGGIAAVSASASVLNAKLVMRIGMRAIIKATYAAQICLTILLIVVTAVDGPYWLAFGTYVFWVAGNFFQAGLTIGNLNALAMEEMAHIAGMAASVIAAISTIGAVMIAAPIGLLFDGTPIPMAIGTLCAASLALWLTTKIVRPSDA